MNGDPTNQPRDPFAGRAADTYRTVRLRMDRSGPLYAALFLVVLVIALLVLLPLIVLVAIFTAIALAGLWLKRLVIPPQRSGAGSGTMRSAGRRNVRVIDRSIQQK
ncbi:MAG: hypothetical protein AAF235_02710 [Planctomycetota bacterium]